MDTDGLKALQTLGDAGHFSIFHWVRKEIPHPMKYTARSADAWCASALFPSGGARPFTYMGIGGVFGATFLYL